MPIIKLLASGLDLLGSLVVKKERVLIKPTDRSKDTDPSIYHESRLKLRVVPASIVSFVIFAPVCLMTGGSFDQCADLFLKLNVSGVV